MKFTAIIPARFASTRLPGKPLLDISGQPMVQRVHQRAVESGAQRVVIATDDERIRDAAREFGAEVCMTSVHHPSGTDRLQEVVSKLRLHEDEIVVNVQGDEPLIPPAAIRQVALNLAANPEAAIATLCEPIHAADVFFDPNAVKVVADQRGFALYFSRAPIPWPRDAFAESRTVLPDNLGAMRHIGLYAYRVRFLNEYVGWVPAPVERWESLEQLRALWQGARIHVEPACEQVPGGVDTPADLDRVRSLLVGR